MKHIYKIFSLTVSLVISLSVQAQELNKDVKVVREYNPIISDAYKINQLPSNEVDSSSFNPQFSYDILSKALGSGLAIEPITAARLIPERKTVLDKSYVKGGLGNYVTLFGELNYNVLRSEEYALGLNLGHTTSAGEVKLEDGSKSSSPFHDTWSSLYFRRFWKDYTLSIDADFMHNIYNYYGYQSIEDDLVYQLPDVTDVAVLGEDLMADRRQRLSSFGVNVGLNNKVLDDNDIPFDINMKFGTFGNVTGVRENNFGLNGKARFYLNTLFLDVQAGIDHFGTSVPDSISPLYNFIDRKMTVVNLSPSVGFAFEGVNLKVGFDMFSQLGGTEDEFNIAPHVVADFVIAEGIVTAFGGVKGDYNINNYQKIQRENRYVAADQMVKNSFHGIHLFGGIKGNFSSQTSFVARVDYSMFDNEHFFVNRSYLLMLPLTTGFVGVVSQSNLFDVRYDDGKLLTVSGELKYEPSKDLNVLLKGKYNGWNLDEQEHAWHKPEVELGVNANYSPKEDLWLNAGLYVMGKRYAFDPEFQQAKKLDSAFDLSIGAKYLLSSKWTVFANLNNILISKYYQWNGYPNQGLNVRAGVGYSF
ncbi:TonB-dependent receptor [Labilibacter sediminis]|nr:TonB-dependent receptor [Labilibacter sediminis]